MHPLLQQASQILQGNDRGGYTVPTAGLYPFQWLWDSGFTALGWAKIDEARAWQEFELLFKGQWPDGMLPHIVFHRLEASYFPGPEVWGTTHTPSTSGITQPPVIAPVLWRMWNQTPDRQGALEKLRDLFPKVLAFHRWLYKARDPLQTGLVAVVHPWEVADNSPLWDASFARIEVDPHLPPYTRRDTSVVESDQRPHQRDYDRYLTLVYAFRRVGYVPQKVWEVSPFRTVDVTFNSILHRANRDLRELALLLGHPTLEIDGWLKRTADGLQTLWNPASGFFEAFDLVTNEAIDIPTSSGFMPLYAGACTPEQGQKLCQRLERWAEQVRFLLPSNDPAHPSFEARRYWRGPVWAILNWMIADGLQQYARPDLAERLRQDTLSLVQKSGFAEYFDPHTGEGLGGGHFSWTAAIVLDWAQGLEEVA